MNKSPMVKQQLLQQNIRPGLAKREAPAGERNNVMRHRVAPLNRRINEPSAIRQK
jgi:hypothetical protein